MAKLAAKASTPDEEDYGSLWKVTELSQMIYKSVCKSVTPTTYYHLSLLGLPHLIRFITG